MTSKPLALRYRRRLWQTLRTVEAVAAGQVPTEVWDQGTWQLKLYRNGHECGTAACFAGWAKMRAGSCAHDVHVWATEHFGLDDDRAWDLFACENTLDDLRRLVREFAGPEPKAGRR